MKESEAKLNAYGSAFGTLDVAETMRLGEYNVLFWEKDPNHPIGQARFFGLEE